MMIIPICLACSYYLATGRGETTANLSNFKFKKRENKIVITILVTHLVKGIKRKCT